MTTILEVTAHVHHVFQAVATLLDEGDTALQRATAFLSQHLSGSGQLAPDATARIPAGPAGQGGQATAKFNIGARENRSFSRKYRRE